MERNLVKLGRIILSVLFIFSGISKLLSLTFFDQLVGELLLGKDFLSQYTAFIYIQILTRLIISGELLLGAALLQEKHFKKIVLPVTQFLLLAFTVHLFYEGFKQNNFVSGNCGCFGDVLPMTILESIIKNVVAMAIGVYIWLKYDTSRDEMRIKSWVFPVILGVVCFATIALTVRDYTPKTFESRETAKKAVEVMTAEPVEKTDTLDEKTKRDSLGTSAEVAEEEEGEEKSINKDEKKDSESNNTEKKETRENTAEKKEPTALEKTKSLLANYGKFSDGSEMNLEGGTTLVCMFSMTCSHCQEVYRNMCELKQYAENKMPKTFLLNYGRELEQNYFFSQAGECKDPHIRIDDYAEFMRILEGQTFPRMLVFKDGEIVKTWDVDSYSKEDFMKYFGIEEQKEDGLNLNNGSNSWGLDDEKEPWE